jgi:hypothetical protein
MAALATIATIASVASAGLTAVGTIAGGNAAAAQGEAEQTAANFEAKQLDIKAKDEFATGQRQAQQYQRQKKLALSTLQTRASGSGFAATDPSTLALADEISTYGTLQEQMALYGGESRQQDMNLAAAGRRFSGASAAALGKAKQTGAYLSAGGTILGGISTMAGKYGKQAAVPTLTGRYSDPSRLGSLY